MMIFGVVIFMGVSFARADRFEIFRFIEHRIKFAFDCRDARCLVIARTASTTAATTAANAWSIVVRIDTGSSVNQRFDIQVGIQVGIKRFIALARRSARSRA